ncbi:MAG: aspartate aminotransferase, partial [Microbacteriaceae bacterium]
DEHLPSVGYRIPEGSYLAWLDVRPLNLGPWPAKEIVQRAKVAFNAGEFFGSGGEGHIRVNLGTSPEILREAIERLATLATE